MVAGERGWGGYFEKKIAGYIPIKRKLDYVLVDSKSQGALGEKAGRSFFARKDNGTS